MRGLLILDERDRSNLEDERNQGVDCLSMSRRSERTGVSEMVKARGKESVREGSLL